MRSLFDKLRCDTFEAVVAASSIIRPGVAESGMMQEYVARATGKRKTTYLHPVMEEVLGDTYGVMVYQEDVLKVAHAIGGLTLAEGDLLRRAMSGKSRSPGAMERLQGKFFASCRKRGLDDRLTGEIWRQIESFAAYSFCKGHSAAFAVLSFQTAWLKAHYPAEFLAAVIANGGGFYSTAAYVQEARRMGLVVEGPCVNESRLDWFGKTERRAGLPAWWERRETDLRERTGRRRPRAAVRHVTGDSRLSRGADFPARLIGCAGIPAVAAGRIRAGLLAVAGLSPELVRRILRSRERDGPFHTPEDFWARARPTPEEAERLILCGACDVFGLPRGRLMICHALWHRAQTHDSPLVPWDGRLPEWARPESEVESSIASPK
jgi:DNA polymerase III alpha subunit